MRCARGYAISMDAAHQTTNRVEKLLKKYRWICFSQTEKLYIWSLKKNDMIRAIPIIERHRGPVSFFSLKGIKDLVLNSTGKPLNVWHAQFGKKPVGSVTIQTIQEESMHLFCAPKKDLLTTEIEVHLQLAPSATATIISHRMQTENWQWILTSDI